MGVICMPERLAIDAWLTRFAVQGEGFATVLARSSAIGSAAACGRSPDRVRWRSPA